MNILITGASGYIGGMLLAELYGKGHKIRCFLRTKRALLEKKYPEADFCYGSAHDKQQVEKVCEGIDCIYYLIHAMGSTGNFEENDRLYATHFADAAQKNNVQRIIYVGGLANESNELSVHLASRVEVGKILTQSGVQTLEFRASIILGTGSLSFEMVRSLVEHLPVMVCPRWVKSKIQPIYIMDLLKYLTAALTLPDEKSYVFDVGGSSVCDYETLIRAYADLRGLTRHLLHVPLLTPHLSSLWLGLVTPLYARVGRKLIDSCRVPTVVENDQAEKIFKVKPIDYREAIKLCVNDHDNGYIIVKWNEAKAAAGIEDNTVCKTQLGNRLIDCRESLIKCTAQEAFQRVTHIGGNKGWYYANFLWKIRGLIDKILGGPGLARGRRCPEELHIGDVVDWWRVEDYTEGKHLLLAAEMKVPGKAWLEYELFDDQRGTHLRQTAYFDPKGLPGLIYWFSISPFHWLIFKGMIGRLTKIEQK